MTEVVVALYTPKQRVEELGRRFCAGTKLEWNVEDGLNGGFRLMVVERGPDRQHDYMLQVNVTLLGAMRPLHMEAMLRAMHEKWAKDHDKGGGK